MCVACYQLIVSRLSLFGLQPSAASHSSRILLASNNLVKKLRLPNLHCLSSTFHHSAGSANVLQILHASSLLSMDLLHRTQKT